jgi:hypothetical protein
MSECICSRYATSRLQYVDMPELAVVHTTSTLKRRNVSGELQIDWGLV